MHHHCPRCLVLVRSDDDNGTPIDHTCLVPSQPLPECSLEAIRERHRRASPGPWSTEIKSVMGKPVIYVIHGSNGEYVGEVTNACEQATGNSEFLTQSRRDTGYLLSALEARDLMIQELQDKIDLLQLSSRME